MDDFITPAQPLVETPTREHEGFNVRPSMDKPGPPAEDGAADGDLVADSKGVQWVRSAGAWQHICLEPMAYIVVDAPGEFEMPRAWVFFDEKEAVDFRLKKLNDTSRRPRTSTPIIKAPIGNTAHNGFTEIDWKKYPAPPREQKQKKFM